MRRNLAAEISVEENFSNNQTGTFNTHFYSQIIDGDSNNRAPSTRA